MIATDMLWRNRRRLAQLAVLLWLAMLGPHCQKHEGSKANTAAQVEQLTGGHTRVVWTRDMDPEPKNPWQYGDTQQLMVYDSRDPRGARVRLEQVSSYGKPMLSPDGETILYSDRDTEEIFRLDFADGKPLKISDGFAIEVWRSSETDRTWVYAGRAPEGQTRVSASVVSVFRFPLDAPSEVEPLADDHEIATDNFQLSRDGAAAAGLFPWPHGGIMRVEDAKWSRVRRGCWASMCPDNSYVFWVFDGGHHVPSFFDPINEESWEVAFDTAPGFEGAEVYHPRWSNRSDVVTLSGPYPKGVFTDLGGGEIMIGKLNADLRKVERWVRVTDNDWPDGCADVWVSDGDSADSARTQLSPDALAKLTTDSSQWKKDRGGFLFRWTAGSEVERIYDSSTGKQLACLVAPTGNAVFGRGPSMRLNGDGAFTTEGFETLIQKFCRLHKVFAIEALLTADEKRNGRIVSYASEEGTNFDLSQEKSNLVLRIGLEGSESGDTLTRVVGRLIPGQTQHFYAKFANGVLAVYIDGKLSHAEEVTGGFDGWRPAPLIFGNSPGGDLPWEGVLWKINLYDNSDLEFDIGNWAAEQIAAIEQATHVRPLKVRAEVVETTPIPAPDSIGDYRRALIGNVYRVVEVIEGELDSVRFAAFHWAILDRELLPKVERKLGEIHVLTLEPMSERPELKSERHFFDSEDFDLELFLDTSFP